MKIKLIVPNSFTDEIGRIWESPIESYGREIAGIAGGFTRYPAEGGWLDGNGKLIQELVTAFDVYANDIFSQQYTNHFRDLAKRIARELNQECVYLEIDGKVEFICK